MRTRSPRFAILSGLAVFLAGQAAFNLAVRGDWLPLDDPTYVEKLTLLRGQGAFFQDRGPGTPTRILVLGSSRSMAGVDARRLAAALPAPAVAFNFATSGAGPFTNALYLRRLLAAGVRPDVVLLELHPAVFTGDNEPHWLDPLRLRAGEPELLRAWGHDVGPVGHLGLRGWAAAAYTFRYPAMSRWAPCWLPRPAVPAAVGYDPWGFFGGTDIPPADRPAARQRVLTRDYAAALSRDALADAPRGAARDVIANCRGRGVRVVPFVSPESAELRAAYRPAATVAFEQFVASLGVPVLRLRDAVPDDLFADGHHLTSPGAEAFTDTLARAYGREAP